MLTSENLKEERPHLGGVQRLFSYGKWSLSLVNAPMLHHYPFAWEAAVMDENGLNYETPLTDDVKVFRTDDEANAFIAEAKAYFEANP